jgi:hypothetical protein
MPTLAFAAAIASNREARKRRMCTPGLELEALAFQLRRPGRLVVPHDPVLTRGLRLP